MNELITLIEDCNKTTGRENSDAVDRLAEFMKYQVDHNTEILSKIRLSPLYQVVLWHIFYSRLGKPIYDHQHQKCIC